VESRISKESESFTEWKNNAQAERKQLTESKDRLIEEINELKNIID
jgi:hypothetical protein